LTTILINRAVVLPIALLGAYLLLPILSIIFILGRTQSNFGEGPRVIDLIIVLLIFVCLVWLFRKPSYVAVVIIGALLLFDFYDRFNFFYGYVSQGIISHVPDYATYYIIDLASIFLFSIAIISLMFFRISKLLSTE